MLDKLTDKIEVRTFLTRVHCPNKACDGILAHDRVTRTENGVHGGVLEYRHRCEDCGAGYWLKDVYPKVSYEAVEVIKEATKDTYGRGPGHAATARTARESEVSN